MKAVEKRAQWKTFENNRAEEARVEQEERVGMSEATRVAVTVEMDRVVESVKGCTEAPALVAAAERVVNAA